MRGTFAIVGALLICCSALAQDAENRREVPRLPAAGVQEFEHSAFCRKYDCVLDAIEPLRLHSELFEWFYNYRVFSENPEPETHQYQMQIGMRLALDGSRADPYMIVRWFPIQSAPEKEFPIIHELIREITGDSKFDAAMFLAKYARSLNFQRGPVFEQGPHASVGAHGLELDFTRGADKYRYPQLTLMIE
jgi:hypothetical protein